MRYLPLVILPLLFLFCEKRATAPQLTVALDQTALRESPGEKSRSVRLLKKGERLSDLGAVGPFESVVQFDGKKRQAPWLQVQTADGTTGWLFAGAVVPADLRYDWLLQKRLLCYFGPALTARRNELAVPLRDVPDEATFAARLRANTALRDTLTQVLAHRPEPGEADILLDFTWLAEAVPGFVYQQVADGTQPWLFADYRHWLRLTQQTEGTQDDRYLAACCTAFPADSIESFFSAGKIQLSDRAAASRLGEGQHLKMLQAIDQALAAGPLFAPELAAQKAQVLEDIFGKNTRYWQPKEKIVSELGKILKAPLRCLSDRDRSELSLRLAMFEQPEANGIQVDLRSGGG